MQNSLFYHNSPQLEIERGAPGRQNLPQNRNWCPEKMKSVKSLASLYFIKKFDKCILCVYCVLRYLLPLWLDGARRACEEKEDAVNE